MTATTDDRYADLMRGILLAEPCRGVCTEPSRLLHHVYIGSQSNAESLRLLRHLGVTHVLNCAGYKGPRPVPNASPYEGLGIDYHEFQAEDTDRYDICQHFPEAFRYLDRVERQGGKVLVHCALGINRSAAVCLGYLMTHSQIPLLEATKIMKDKRRIVLANRHFQRLLVRYARSRGLLDRTEAADETEKERLDYPKNGGYLRPRVAASAGGGLEHTIYATPRFLPSRSTGFSTGIPTALPPPRRTSDGPGSRDWLLWTTGAERSATLGRSSRSSGTDSKWLERVCERLDRVTTQTDGVVGRRSSRSLGPTGAGSRSRRAQSTPRLAGSSSGDRLLASSPTKDQTRLLSESFNSRALGFRY